MKIPRLSIFWRFVLLGILVFIILGVFLSSLVEPVLIKFILREQELISVVFVNRIVAEHLLPEDFTKPATEESKRRFETFIHNLQTPGLFRIKFWNPEGVIVYSDEEELIGRTFPLNEGLQKALDLKAHAELETFDPNDPRYAYEISFGEGLNVYAPITFGASPEVIGVIETYARAGFLRQQINELKNLFILRIILSLAFMFAVLSFIVWRASRTVDRQRKKLQEYATGLERMVEERTHQLKEAMERQAKQANELLRLKDQFVFIAAHELRVPASAIKWGLEVLESKQPRFFKQEKKLFDILRQGNERLLALVSDILGVARIEGKTLRVELKPVSLFDIASESVGELQPLAQEHEVTVYQEIPQDIPTMLADPIRLKEVLINLLSNAIKYNSKGGEVRISIDGKDGRAVIHVADTGIGISSEDQKRVFEKFWRAKETQGIEGTGLGLFIVKQLIELMRGKIWFESQPGKGTTFSFTLQYSK